MAAYTQPTTRISRVLIGLAVLWGIIGLSGAGSWALDDELSRATLRGVEGVHVVVEDVRPDVERAGLTRQQLQTDVELRLRKAGMRVLTRAERLEMPGAPWLYIDVNVALRSDPPVELTAFNIYVELKQEASLKTTGSLAIVSTWSVGAVGGGGSKRLANLRSTVRDLVDQFINAYLSVHPRPAGITAPSSASPRRDLIRQVQERLQTVGYNPGTIDGAMGPQTKHALLWFQNAQGLRSTGDLDEPTLNALGIR